jgi:hypothetical protein
MLTVKTSKVTLASSYKEITNVAITKSWYALGFKNDSGAAMTYKYLYADGTYSDVVTLSDGEFFYAVSPSIRETFDSRIFIASATKTTDIVAEIQYERGT